MKKDICVLEKLVEQILYSVSVDLNKWSKYICRGGVFISPSDTQAHMPDQDRERFVLIH